VVKVGRRPEYEAIENLYSEPISQAIAKKIARRRL